MIYIYICRSVGAVWGVHVGIYGSPMEPMESMGKLNESSLHFFFARIQCNKSRVRGELPKDLELHPAPPKTPQNETKVVGGRALCKYIDVAHHILILHVRQSLTN